MFNTKENTMKPRFIYLIVLLIFSIGCQGPIGPAGKDGIDGKDGKDGKDAQSDKQIIISFLDDRNHWTCDSKDWILRLGLIHNFSSFT